MKRLLMLLATTALATTSMALVNYNDSVHWTGTGDWTNLDNWAETAASTNDNAVWNRPGWVVGNPANTNNSTDVDWNRGYAHIDNGTVDITPGSHPDGTVRSMWIGSDNGNSTINISTDFTVREKIYAGYQSQSSDVATVNQTAGNVSYGTSASSRTYWGRGDGQLVYNLSGGTVATPGDWNFFGNEVDNTFDTGSFTLNQTGGTFTDTGAGHLVVSDERGTHADVNISGGTFKANAAGFRIASKGVATVTVNGTGSLESSATDFGAGYYTDSGIAATGTLNVADSGSVTHSGANFMVGRSGHGVLNISDSATVSLSGKDVWVGRYGTGSGEINQSGGTFTASGSGILEIGDSANTSGKVTVSGGTFNANSGASTRIGNSGTGTVVVEGTGKLSSSSTFLSVGSHGGASGTLTVKGNGSVNTTGEFGVGMWRETSGVNGVGVLNISENGAVTNNSPNHFSIGRSGTGTLNLSDNGKLIVTTASDFNIAAWGNGSQGTVNMSGGVLRHLGNKSLYVGRTGNGTFIQTGGEVDVARFILAKESGSEGFYSISGGSLSARNYITGGLNGTGTFEVLGSDATSIESANISFYGDTLRVVLDENGSTLLVADKSINTAYNGQIDIRGTFELDTDGTFNGTVGDVYNIAWASDTVLTNGMTFTDLSGTEFELSILDNVNQSGNAGTGQMLQATVIPEPATLGMIVAVGASLLFIRRKFMI